MLQSGSEWEKRWLVLRILEHAHFEDVFDYLTVDDVVDYFPYMASKSVMRNYWQRVLEAWGYDV